MRWSPTLRLVTTAPLAERFDGFPDGAIPFLLELQAEQSRVWFKAHQGDFQRLLRRPLELYVAELRERLLDAYSGLADVRPHIFRIQRDTRFSHDKSPYKSNVSASVPIRAVPVGVEDYAVPGLYLSYGLDGAFVAAGLWDMRPPFLGRFREALDNPVWGPPAQAIVDRLLADGFRLGSHGELKRVPPPYPQDHPRAALLKLKGLAVSADAPEELAGSRSLLNWSEARLRAAAPLLEWLSAHVG